MSRRYFQHHQCQNDFVGPLSVRKYEKLDPIWDVEVCRAVDRRAVEQSRALGNDYVGIDHLLLALLDPVAASSISMDLKNHEGLTYDRIFTLLQEVLVPVSSEPGLRYGGVLSYTPRLRQALERARSHAAFAQEEFSDWHFLYAILDEVDALQIWQISEVSESLNRLVTRLAEAPDP